MRNCNILETLILYVFSAWYVIKEWFGRLFWLKKGLAGQVFLRCEGRTALITGGTAGIGFETAKKLLSFGMNVIIASNATAQQSEKCLQELRVLFPKSKVEVWYVDLFSMSSVKALAEKYLISGLPLHVLINNAGIMFAPYKLSDDGLESHIAINYFSHCLLTKLLLPRLQESSSSKCKSRIINVSSCLHYLTEIDFENLCSMDSNSYCRYHSYMQSKLCLVMFTQYLNQFFKSGGCEVLVHSVHPGVIFSGLYKYVWWAPFLGPFFLQKPDKGAEIVVYATLSANLESEGGKYIEQCRVMKPSAYSCDRGLQTRLWNETWKTLFPWLDELDDIQMD